MVWFELGWSGVSIVELLWSRLNRIGQVQQGEGKAVKMAKKCGVRNRRYKNNPQLNSTRACWIFIRRFYVIIVDVNGLYLAYEANTENRRYPCIVYRRDHRIVSLPSPTNPHLFGVLLKWSRRANKEHRALANTLVGTVCSRRKLMSLERS